MPVLIAVWFALVGGWHWPGRKVPGLAAAPERATTWAVAVPGRPLWEPS